jgi:hypothetical protein
LLQRIDRLRQEQILRKRKELMGRRPSIDISMTQCDISLVVTAYETAGVMSFAEERVAHVGENAEDVGDWSYGGTLKNAIQQSVARVAKGQTAAITGTRVSSGEAVDLLFDNDAVCILLGYKAAPELYPDWNMLCSEFIRPLDKPNAIDHYRLNLW